MLSLLDIILKDAPKEGTLYYTNDLYANSTAMTMQQFADKANIVLTVYPEITGFKIETIEQLTSLCKDPEAHYKTEFFEKNKADFKFLGKLNLDYSTLIKLPDNFHEVHKVVNKLKAQSTGELSFRDWTINNGRIEPDEKAIQRIRNAVFLVASTKEEVQRLRISNQIIAALTEVELVVNQQLHKVSAKRVIEGKLYARHNLPYQLQIVSNLKGETLLIPNPKWVSGGFESTSFLGVYVPTSHEKEQARRPPRLGEKWVKFYRPLKAGTKKLYTCKQSEYEKHSLPIDEMLSGVYNELGEPWGTPIDRTKPRPIKETQWSPELTIK